MLNICYSKINMHHIFKSTCSISLQLLLTQFIRTFDRITLVKVLFQNELLTNLSQKIKI